MSLAPTRSGTKKPRSVNELTVVDEDIRGIQYPSVDSCEAVGTSILARGKDVN